MSVVIVWQCECLLRRAARTLSSLLSEVELELEWCRLFFLIFFLFRLRFLRRQSSLSLDKVESSLVSSFECNLNVSCLLALSLPPSAEYLDLTGDMSLQYSTLA